jgi:hypothetical protein
MYGVMRKYKINGTFEASSGVPLTADMPESWLTGKCMSCEGPIWRAAKALSGLCQSNHRLPLSRDRRVRC